MMTFSTRRGRAVIALAAALTLVGSIAEARVGRGGSFGSRGARTFDAPPVTRTAPNQAGPIERSQIPQGQFQNRPGVPPAGQVAQPRRFGSGLFAGLLGAGLLGMLFGSGFFGGLAGLASFFGLLIQVALLALVITFAVRWFRRRHEPAAAHAYGRTMGAGPTPSARGLGGSGLGGAGLGGALGGMGLNRARTQEAPRRPGVRDEVGIGEADYAAFERQLHEVQAAYSAGDVAALWRVATPEMAGYIQEELNENASNGVVNTVSNVRLVQGDLSEAWREGPVDYATVAMRFAHTDVTVEKATGRVVQGDAEREIEATELWTFRRERGGEWKLSAIQQA
ncbi:MAG TPA: TIM44-like domain-containing protein [Microvirga sp.]|nr:TIM44-like domain-containing protein [Microvirga sp.]